MLLLETQEVGHRFDYPLFHSVNLKVEPQESLSIVGVSGSGKSTLLHVLSTLLQPKNGIVKLMNQTIYDLSHDELIAIRRNQVGIIFQSHYLFKGFSATENLQIASLLAQQEIDIALLRKFGIDHILKNPAAKLSGGEQQRLSIARVLTKKPKIIFADEPTGNLDQETASHVMDVLFDYIHEHQAALILVTHDQTLASRCHHSYELKGHSLHKLQG